MNWWMLIVTVIAGTCVYVMGFSEGYKFGCEKIINECKKVLDDIIEMINETINEEGNSK